MTLAEQRQAAELEAIVENEQRSEASAESETLTGEWQPNESEQAATMNTADILAPILQIGFGMIASVKGEHWKITDDLATEAGAEFGRCIDHYWPEMNTAPWVGSAMALGMLLTPRMMEDRRIEAEKAQAESEAPEKGVDNAD
jgi:hypothetical protein